MSDKTPELVVSTESYFIEVVEEAFEKRNLDTYPLVRRYIADLLTQFTLTQNLYDWCAESGKHKQPTLAEQYLTAMSEPSAGVRVDMLKKLGDTSLYVSGFFGDSLKKKLVDVDYYADIGGSAYSNLASSVDEDTFCRLYSEISIKFLKFVDVLTFISQQAKIQGSEDLMRLYDRATQGDSELAREQLLEKGLISPAEIKNTKN